MDKTNSIVCIGTLAAKPRIEQIQGCFYLLTFLVYRSLLMSDGKKDDQSIRVILWRPAGDLLLANLKSGSLVSIKGSLRKAAVAAIMMNNCWKYPAEN